MKKALVLLLCALAVFAIVSCKNEPPAPETFKVTFETGTGATQIDPVTVEKDAKVAKPADPTRLGSVFGGWFTEAECTNGYNFDTPVTKSFTLYAKWTVLPPAKIAKMTVTTGLGKDVKKNSHDKVQFNIDLRDVLGEDGGIQSGDVVTLKFRTSRDIYQYDIRTNKKVKQAGVDKEIDVRWVYETFRGTLADPVLGEDGWYTLTYTFGDSYYTSKTKPNYETDQYYNMGINFRGYLLTDDVFEIKDVVYTRGERSYSIPMKESYNAASSFISYAEVENHEWTIPKTQVLVYFADASDEYPLAESVAKGGVPQGLKETGYKFEYFSDSGKTTAFDMTAAVEKDVELYVTKTALPTYAVTFDSQGGSDVEQATVYEGDKVEEPEDPTKAYSIFGGWFTEAACTTEYDFDTPVTAAFTLYAKWSPAISQLTVNTGIDGNKKNSYDKVQFNIDLRDVLGEKGGLEKGDVLTLKFRTSRDIYQYDIRTNKKTINKETGEAASKDVRWVYETYRGTLADPVLGEDGWYTLTYTFSDDYYTSKDTLEYDKYQYYNLGLNFRGYLLKDDVFEIKDIVLTREDTAYAIPMKKSYNAAGFIDYAEVADHSWTIPKTQVLVYWINGESEKPKAEAVVKGEVAEGLAEEGYKVAYYSDKQKTTAYDITAKVTADAEVYVTKTPGTFVLTATKEDSRFQFKWDDLAIKAGDVFTLKYKSEKSLTKYTIRSIDPSEKYANEQPLSGEPEEGWYTYTFTIPEGKEAKGLGLALFAESAAAVGDVVRIKDITLNDTKLVLVQKNAWAGCEPTITTE